MSLIDLKLDTNTIRQLFPEGTEIRSALQQSVIQNIVKEMVLKDSDNKIRKAVSQEIELLGARVPSVKAAVETELKTFFTKRGWNNYDSTFELDQAMRKEAIEVAQNIIQDKITKCIEEAAKKLENRIEDTLRMTEHRWEQMIVSRINNHFGNMLDKAIAERIAAAFPEVKK